MANKTQEDLIKQTATLQKQFAELEANPACWKAVRKLEAVKTILATEWVEPATPEAPKETAPVVAAPKPEKAANK